MRDVLYSNISTSAMLLTATFGGGHDDGITLLSSQDKVEDPTWSHPPMALVPTRVSE